MPSAFERAIERVLGHEGGYVNDPTDPGGETKWGISKRAFPQYNIRAITRDDAIGIYKEHYWERAKCDKLPEAISFQLLDAAVNHGIGTAIRFLQRAIGVADDGVIGPVSLAAVGRCNPTVVVLLFNKERLLFYTKLSGWAFYGRGWVARVANNLSYAARDN